MGGMRREEEESEWRWTGLAPLCSPHMCLGWALQERSATFDSSHGPETQLRGRCLVSWTKVDRPWLWPCSSGRRASAGPRLESREATCNVFKRLASHYSDKQKCDRIVIFPVVWIRIFLKTPVCLLWVPWGGGRIFTLHSFAGETVSARWQLCFFGDLETFCTWFI